MSSNNLILGNLFLICKSGSAPIMLPIYLKGSLRTPARKLERERSHVTEGNFLGEGFIYGPSCHIYELSISLKSALYGENKASDILSC